MSPALLPAPGTPGAEDDVHLPLREHLVELRKRLKWAVLSILGGFSLCYYWSAQIFHWLMRPVLAALPEGERALHYSSSLEPFMNYLKVGLWAGVFLASPLIFLQLWLFVAPGLYRRERRMVTPFVAAATLFFLGGSAFCYFVILPPAFEFLLSTAGVDIKPMLMMSDQLGLVMTMMIAFGLVFELPLILTLLAMLGIVDHKFLSKYRRHAIVLNVIIAAIVTPTGDPFNLALMAVPMLLCYELGVLGAWVFRKKGTPARLTA